jgi:chromosome segregation ATPase
VADTRIDHIEETLSTLNHKVDDLSVQLHDSTQRLDRRIDGLETQLHESTERLDGRIDTVVADMKAGFDQTQAAFDDHRRYAEFLWQGVRDDMSQRFNYVERRFDRMDERFDRLDDRFDRLERLIEER